MAARRVRLHAPLSLFGQFQKECERVVDELASKGVVFERYDEGPIITNDQSIATFEREAKVAYFKDPHGNTLSIAQAPRP